jgi:hypothetical protein
VKHWTVAVTVPTGSMAIVAQSVCESKLHDADGPVAAGTSLASHAGPIIASAGLVAATASAAATTIDPPIRRIIRAPCITVSPCLVVRTPSNGLQRVTRRNLAQRRSRGRPAEGEGFELLAAR